MEGYEWQSGADRSPCRLFRGSRNENACYMAIYTQAGYAESNPNSSPLVKQWRPPLQMM